MSDKFLHSLLGSKRSGALAAVLGVVVSLGAVSMGPTPSRAAAAGGKPGIGDSITYTGLKQLHRITVTLTKVVDPLKSAPGANKPRRGFRFTAIYLKVRNTGRVALKSGIEYSGSELGSKPRTALIDSRGRKWLLGAVSGTVGPTGPAKAGGRADVVLHFEVPTKAKLRILSLTLKASGFGRETREWEL